MRTQNEQKLKNHKKSEVSVGTLRTAKMKGMSLMTKVSLILAFTILFGIFLYDGWYGPNTVQAAITIQQSWTKAYDAAASPGNLTYTVNAGSNRMLVVAVTSAVSTSATQTATATFGGNALTQQVGDGGTSARMHTWLFYLKDTPAVMNGTAQTLNVTVTGGTMINNAVYVAVFAGVDQSASPITNSQNFNNNSGVTSAAFSPALTVNSGDQAIYVSNIYYTNTTIPTYTIPANWTSGANATGTNAGTPAAWKTEVANRTIPVTNTTDTANITSINPSSRVSLSGMSIKQVCVRANPTVTISAPTTLNINQGGSVNYTVSVTNNDNASCAATTFNLSKIDTLAVPNANFSASTLPATIGPINGGATMTVTLTHTATAGATVGSTEQTSVSTAADANHAAVTAPAPAVSTVVAYCVRANPTVTISAPTTLNINQGGSVNYTVSVTNNDNASCAATTFNLSKIDTLAVPNANFSASTLPATIGPINGGATMTVTLTHTATAGATVGSTEQTSVSTAADANHAAVTAPNPVVSTVAQTLTIQQGWTKVIDQATSPGSASYTVNGGSNRLMVVAVTTVASSSGSGTTSVTFGGTAMTKQVSDDSTSLRPHTALFYLKDAQIPAGAQTLNVSTTAGSLLNLTVYVAVFAGIDQSSTITNSRNYNNDSGVTSAAFSTPLNVNAYDQAVYVSNICNSSNTTIPTYTISANWTSAANDTGTGSSSAWKNEVANRTIPVNNTTDTANITSISPSSRVSLSGMSMKQACMRAAPTVSITTGNQNINQGGSVNYTVSVTNNDNASCAATTFTLSKADTPAVPNSNFSASTLLATIGPISGGQTMTVTLTHTATAGATVGSTEQTSVSTAADANHAAVTAPAPAISTVFAYCVRANPTVTVGAPTSRNINQGGSVNYTVSVTNNDNATCAATTFTLSKTDTPVVPNSNFSASSLAATSTGSLDPGTTWTTILAHAATASATVGSTEQTSISTVADANHAAVTAPAPAISTVFAYCVRANPTVTISAPTTLKINQGGLVNYTVSVTNNDNANCAATTFTLSKTDTPAVPNSNFSASTLPATIGPINSGAAMTVTLTHTATAGATVGSTEQTSVSTAADANHAAVTAPNPAISTVVEESAKIVYSINTDTPQYRDYDGSSNSFLGQTPTSAGAINQRFMVDRSSSLRDEHLVGYVTSGGVLYVLKWDGTQWTNEWNYTVGGDGVTGRRFDIDYQNTGHHVMVVYSTNVSGQFAYRIFGGTVWTAEKTFTMSRLTNVIVSLRLVAMPEAAGNGFAVAALDASGGLSTMIWDAVTETWGNEPTSALSANVYRSSSPGDVPAFDLAYENTTGDLLVVNSTSGSSGINYWTFSGGTWTGPNTFSTGNNCGAIFAAGDPNPGSNNILVAATRTVTSGSSTIMAGIWNGTSFSAVNSATSMGSGLSANRMLLRGGFLTYGGTTAAVIVYNDGTANRLGYSYTMNAGANWTATNTTAVTIGSGTKAWIDVAVSPKIPNILMVTLSDGASDLWAKRLVLTAGPTFTWTNADGGTALTTSLATISAQNFSFDYDRFIRTTELGDGMAGTSATVCPGDANQKIGGFSFNTLDGTDSVTALTVTTTNQVAIAGMQIWDETGTTQYFGTVNNPGSDTWNFSGGTPIPVTEDVAKYKILVTYKGYGTAPAGDTPTTAYVFAYTCTNIKSGTDTADTTLTLNNTSALAATWGVNSGGMGTATLNWTKGTAGDSGMIVRYTTDTDTTMPSDGTVYAVSNPYGVGGTVAYVGSATTFLDTGLSPGTYYYRIFEYSGCLKYAVTAPWSGAIPIVSANQTAAGTATAVGESATSIKVTMPHSYDANANNTYTVDYKLSFSGTWTNWVTDAPHSASPYTTTITGLTTKQTYDVRCTYNDPDGVGGANPQIISVILVNNLVHNSITTGSTKWGSNGWGITGGKYGEFVCGTCHAPRATNIKGIISPANAPADNFPGSIVNFQSTATPGGFGDDTTIHTASEKICEVCHSQTTYHKYNQSAIAGHESCVGIYDCTSCHPHNQGFKSVGGCTICHSLPVGNRVAVVGKFSGDSHHIQGTAVTNQQCYQCHWEANSDGSVNTTYHGGCVNPGSAVNLVIYGNGTRPTAYISGTTAVQYTANGTRAEIQKINQHCLSCHSAQNSATQPFGDGKTPNQYAWDGMSIDGRYSQTGTTTWGKYTAVTNASKRNLTKSYSAHGNAQNNYGGGWDTTVNGTGIDSNLTPTRGGASAVNVACFDCHNSHGSTVSGTTTSYTSATTNGGILKDTTTGKGGYAMTYKPQAGGSPANHNVYNTGAAICFDCHITAVSGTTPWGYQSTFGATQAIMGYTDTPYFGPGASGPKQRYTYKVSANGPKGGHFGESSSLTTPVMGAIGGLCTPCHDPHGVSPTLNQAYAVPLFKGTWMTSPYKEDTAPSATNEKRGQEKDSPPYAVGSTPFYHIDQNTFSGDINTRQAAGGTALSWNWSSTTRVTQTVNEFAGLCLKCHPKSSIAPGTNSTWKSVDRIHNTVKGWGTFGGNANNAIHSFTCSKCHVPHSSSLNRLMVTNCLDFTHRGRLPSGGTVPAKHSRSGDEGRGAGQFPGGGGGRGNEEHYPGPWFFGTTSSPYIRECHGVSGAGGTTGYPSNQLWNVLTPW